LRDKHAILEKREITRARLTLEHCPSHERKHRSLHIGRRVLHHQPGSVGSIVTYSVAPRPSRPGDDRANSPDERLVGRRQCLRSRIALWRLSTDPLDKSFDARTILLILLSDPKQLGAERSIESCYSTSCVSKSRCPLGLPPQRRECRVTLHIREEILSQKSLAQSASNQIERNGVLGALGCAE
jgi:hypothetical protein